MMMPTDRDKNRPTLSSVAIAAGVSVSTASLVLSGKSTERRISEATANKIRAAAALQGFAPNMLTRSLRKGRTHIVSLYSTFRHREWGDIYMDQISSAVETACGEIGYDVLIQCNFNRSIQETFEFLNGGIAEGVLMFAPAADDPLVALLRSSITPVVILNSHDPLGQYSSVGDDVYSGMESVADQIVREGHRSVLAVTSDHSDIRDADLRIRLLSSRLEKEGVVTQVACWNGESEQMRRQLSEMRESNTLPTAAFCWHDRRAYAFIEVCEELGIQIPDQLAVFGYDAIHWPSTSRHVVSSVSVNLRHLAQVGAKLLDDVILNPYCPVRHELSPVHFVQGTTSGTSRMTNSES